ncbi:747_t:CDS:1, partial [Gigaspora margarita]
GGALVPETLGTDHTQEFVFNTAILENTVAGLPEPPINEPP